MCSSILGPVGGLGGAGPVPVSAPEVAAEDTKDTEDDEDGDDVEEHVFATADPRDFTDDAGPQYEDEDFDEDIEEDGERGGRAPTAGRADAVVAQEDAEPAPAVPPSADETGAAQAGRSEPPAPPRPDPEDELPPLESFSDRYTDRELTWMDFNERVGKKIA